MLGFNAAVALCYEKWTFTLWGRNIFDKEYEERVFEFDNGFGTERHEAPAAPQHFGATANYNW